MPSDTSNGPSDDERALRARLSRPIPERVRREMDVCANMDFFEAALNEHHAVMSAVVCRPAAVSRFASADAVQTCWRDSLAELQASLGKADRSALTLTRSIKVMLGLV